MGLHRIRCVVVPLVVAVVVVTLFLLGILEEMELLILDLRLRTFAGGTPPPVTFAVIDHNTLIKLGRWPIPRGLYALVLEKIMDDGARMVLMDIDFSSIGPDPAEDRELIQFVKNVENLVLAVQMEERKIPEGALIRNVSLPMVGLLEGASSLGSITFEVDPDGVIRRVPEPIDFIDRMYHPMGVVGARAVDSDVPLHYPDGALINMSDENLRSLPVVSLEKIIDDQFTPGIFRDRIVLMGAITPELHDFWLTPIGVVPGVYIQDNGRVSSTSSAR